MVVLIQDLPTGQTRSAHRQRVLHGKRSADWPCASETVARVSEGLQGKSTGERGQEVANQSSEAGLTPSAYAMRSRVRRPASFFPLSNSERCSLVS
jgi:hypothetical protein